MDFNVTMINDLEKIDDNTMISINENESKMNEKSFKEISRPTDSK